MRIIHVSEYDYETMQLAKPVYDSQKRILLASGRQIHPKYMERLTALKISHLFVDDHISKGITLDEMIDMPNWIDAIQLIQSTYEAVGKNQQVNVTSLQQLAGKLIAEVQRRPLLVPVPISTIPNDLYLYAHTVNVSLLAVQVGRKLGLNQMQLRDLVIGCLLHDIGKIKTDDNDKYTSEGFEIIRKIREFNILCAHVAYQHLESLNGNGLPRGISGQDFHLYAQICGIAKKYENMVTKEGIPPHEVMERLMTMSGTVYDMKIVQAFVQGIPSYAPGTKIELNTRETAIVVRLDSHMQRPTVRTIQNETIIKLEENPTILIKGLA